MKKLKKTTPKKTLPKKVEVIDIKKVNAEKQELTSISIHTVSQLYAGNREMSKFSDEKVNDFVKKTGISLINRPESYGIVLNQSQQRVLEGILKAFSDTNYEGDEMVDKYKSLEKTYSTTNIDTRKIINETYSNVDKIPIIRLSQADIINLAGYNAKRQGDKVDVLEAIAFLATKQFCFYWIRLKKDNKGELVKNKNGDFIKEEIMEVSTLFRIRVVREEGDFQHYEIHPSCVIIDQINSNYGGNYFLLIPTNWRDEVTKLTGKRASSYTYEFLLWLRVHYEQIRRHNAKQKKNKPFVITKSWENVAIALKMPESLYKSNRKKASKIIQTAYEIALRLGYLIKIENNQLADTDTLYLNESYYPKPGELV